MNLRLALASLALAGCSTTAPAQPAATTAVPHPEHEAILKTIDTFLLALGNGDRELQKSVELPDGMIAFTRITAAGAGPVRRMKQSEMQSQPGHDPFIELYWDAKVEVRGPFAHVWAPYELRDNGAVVHCGIDAFQLVKMDGAWKIHGSLSTMEPAACDELRPASAGAMRPRDGWKETPNQ